MRDANLSVLVGGGIRLIRDGSDKNGKTAILSLKNVTVLTKIKAYLCRLVETLVV